VIRLTRKENGQTLFYSKQSGANHGAPQGGWTHEEKLASEFESVKVAQQFIDTLVATEYRPTCRIEET
jgi:hypothetical protein